MSRNSSSLDLDDPRKKKPSSSKMRPRLGSSMSELSLSEQEDKQKTPTKNRSTDRINDDQAPKSPRTSRKGSVDLGLAQPRTSRKGSVDLGMPQPRSSRKGSIDIETQYSRSPRVGSSNPDVRATAVMSPQDSEVWMKKNLEQELEKLKLERKASVSHKQQAPEPTPASARRTEHEKSEDMTDIAWDAQLQLERGKYFEEEKRRAELQREPSRSQAEGSKVRTRTSKDAPSLFCVLLPMS